MVIPETVVQILCSGAKHLTGAKKRIYMAEAVQSLGYGSQRACENQLGWCRNTIRKGAHELKNGVFCIDYFNGRGRKKLEDKNQYLITHIQEIVEGSSQADPSMKSSRLYVKLTCNQIRFQLKEKFGYSDADVPSKSAMRRILNENQYHLKKVRKTLPKK